MQNTVQLLLANLTMTYVLSNAVAGEMRPQRGIACEIAEPQGGESVRRPCLEDRRTIRSGRCYPVLTLAPARCEDGK